MVAFIKFYASKALFRQVQKPKNAGLENELVNVIDA